MKTKEGFVCVLCKKHSLGWGDKKEFGNNPEPLASEGECCGDCDRTKVIPERMRNRELAQKPNYKKGFRILIEYFDSIPDEEKSKVNKKLIEVGL